jgi:hypothetical protein
MSVFGDKLKQAGFDTFEQQFAARAIRALQAHRGSVIEAWRSMGPEWGYEYLRERLKDMKGPAPSPSTSRSPAPPVDQLAAKPTARVAAPVSGSPQPPNQLLAERPDKAVAAGREPDATRLKAMKEVNERIARNILDLRRTSDGRQWGSICPYELGVMKREGAIATAFETLLGPLNDKQRETPLRELLSDKQARLVFQQVDSHETA